MATAATRESQRLDFVRSITAWKPGEAPRELDSPADADPKALLWIDIDGEASRDRAAEVAKLLAPSCPGITEEMVVDLATPYKEPAGRRYGDGADVIELAATFGVEARRDIPHGERGVSQGAGVLVFHPVCLLADRRWLVSCWLPSRSFRGALKTGDTGTPGSPADVRDAVAQDWLASSPQLAGDLGVLVMYELALTCAPAWREVYAWLEDWELSLYTQSGYDPKMLPQLWGSMAVLRDWIAPLNRIGLRTDLEKAWLPVSDHKAVCELDDRYDHALKSLRELAVALRSSFQLLHYQLAEEEQARNNAFQGRIAVLATAFLIPTLVVGFYGANTWVPGVGTHWGFWVMVAAIVILSAAGIGYVLYTQRRGRAQARWLEHEQAQIRAGVARDERVAPD